MKNIFLLFLFVSIGSCSNQPRNVKIKSNYVFGFSISETPEMINELKKIGDFCIELNPDIEQIQPLIIKGGDVHYHIFNIWELIEVLNRLNDCSSSDKSITLNQVTSDISYFARMRYDGYTVSFDIIGNTKCNGSNHEHKAEASSGLENYSFIGYKKQNALIASSTVLAFYKTVSEIYTQMALECDFN